LRFITTGLAEGVIENDDVVEQVKVGSQVPGLSPIRVNRLCKDRGKLGGIAAKNDVHTAECLSAMRKNSAEMAVQTVEYGYADEGILVNDKQADVFHQCLSSYKRRPFKVLFKRESREYTVDPEMFAAAIPVGAVIFSASA
jgi:hypothetical protein